MEQFWRMRFKCNGHDFTSESWTKNLVGIWYGAWRSEEFDKLSNRCEDDSELRVKLTEINAKRGLKWEITNSMVKTIWRFWGMKESSDWVFTQYEGCLHVAQIAPGRPFDVAEVRCDNEVYKARRITNKRSFGLSRLPDCFRLLASAGQANCHEVHGTRALIELLCKCKDEDDVRRRWRAMSLSERIDALGPKSWETICEAYLILEQRFLPMGLGAGGTLPVFDLIGRSQDGSFIQAQCKGNRSKVLIDTEFLEQSRQVKPSKKRKTFFFAYAGVKNKESDISDVKVLTNKDVLKWLQTSSSGREYVKLMTN
jgi:hypothetical protein